MPIKPGVTFSLAVACALIQPIAGLGAEKDDENPRPYYRKGDAKPNLKEEAVAGYLAGDKHCTIYGDSSAVNDGIVTKEEKRVLFAETPALLLKKCEQLEKNVGPNGCDSFELAGHARYGSVANSAFGVNLNTKLESEKWPFFVEKESPDLLPPAPLRSKIIACIQRLLPPGRPVIFTTCGGSRRPIPAINGEERILQYCGIAPAMDAMAGELDRPIIRALGPCSSTDGGKGATCYSGWCMALPKIEVVRATGTEPENKATRAPQKVTAPATVVVRPPAAVIISVPRGRGFEVRVGGRRITDTTTVGNVRIIIGNTPSANHGPAAPSGRPIAPAPSVTIGPCPIR